MGDSIGTWEGDTLVIDVIGFNDLTWLDRSGHPHSDALHLTERMKRVDHDTLTDDITIEDSKAYAKPWTVQAKFQLKSDQALDWEGVCETGWVDRQWLVLLWSEKCGLSSVRYCSWQQRWLSRCAPISRRTHNPVRQRRNRQRANTPYRQKIFRALGPSFRPAPNPGTTTR